MTAPESPLLTTEEAAGYLRSTKATLDTWRYQRTGPPFVKRGSRVFYLQADLDRWLTERTVKPRQVEPARPAADANRIPLRARESKRTRRAS